MDYGRQTFNKEEPKPSTTAGQDEKMRYKAAKYHYKIQHHLNENYVKQGKAIPQGYAEYLQPFRG